MKHILYTALILSLFSCNKSEIVRNERDDASFIELKTRSTATSDFANNTTIRLAMFNSGTENIYLIESNNNIYAKKINGEWGFNYDGSNNFASKFGYIQDAQDKIDIVGVYPNILDADLTAVPFTCLSQNDYMVAKSENLALTEQTLNAELNFERVMTLLNFHFKLKNSQNYTEVTCVIIELLDDSDVAQELIISEGEINFNSNEITSSAMASSLKVYENIYLSSNATSYVDFPIYLAPCSLTGATKLIVTVMVDGITLPNPLVIPISDIDEDFELKRGIRYNFHIEIDNYIKLKGDITKQTDWSVGEVVEKDI